MFTKILYAIDIINKSPKNSRIYLRFSMRQKKDREAYLHLPFSIGSIPIPYGINIERVRGPFPHIKRICFSAY